MRQTQEPGSRRSRLRLADGTSLSIRPYLAADAEATLRIFERAVRITARSGYSEAEVEAWLGGPRELAAWSADRARVRTFVADIDGTVAGFADLSEAGYVDRLFVDPDFGGRGVATALLADVRRSAHDLGITEMTTHASLVARPVFEAAGFRVEYAETVVKDGERLNRFFMSAKL